MIFGEFGGDEAVGAVLAHTLKRPGVSFRKGRVLTREDVALLQHAGIDRVAAARLEEDDLSEDAAAAAVAKLLAGASLAPRLSYTGRCNLHAMSAGVFLVERERIDALNRIDEAITVGTRLPYAGLRARQVAATVKIIPFAVPRRLLAAWRETIGGEPPLRLAPFRSTRAAIILSEAGNTTPKTLAEIAVVTRRRIERLGSRLDCELRCDHSAAAISGAIGKACDAGCELILIAGASVTKDRGDVVPAGVLAAGGCIEHFGMPVEPGNMLLLARVGPIPIINLPGCARSPHANGLDWILERLLARLPVGAGEIMGMGVGGLIRSPLAEDEYERTSTPGHAPSRIAALILAAGRSSRMGGQNKLLATMEGVPLVRRSVESSLASRCCQVMVVTGCDATQVDASLAGCPVSRVFNPAYAEGMASSLACGLRALAPNVDGVVVLLADMPWIAGAHIDRLIAAFESGTPAIIAPERYGRRGNPILWPRRYFEAMQQIVGDVGARDLLDRHGDEVRAVEFDTDAIFADVDTPAELAATIAAGRTS